MKEKTLFYKKLKGGGTFEFAVGFDKPFTRNRQRDHHRDIRIFVLPTMWISSIDNYRGADEYCEQTTVELAWLFFYLYFELFRPLKNKEDTDQ